MRRDEMRVKVDASRSCHDDDPAARNEMYL